MIAIDGKLTFASVEQWLQRSDELLADGQLDLSAVSYCDSAGAALLLELARRAKGAGRTLQLHNPPEQLRQLAAFFGIGGALPLAS